VLQERRHLRHVKLKRGYDKLLVDRERGSVCPFHGEASNQERDGRKANHSLTHSDDLTEQRIRHRTTVQCYGIPAATASSACNVPRDEPTWKRVWVFGI